MTNSAVPAHGRVEGTKKVNESKDMFQQIFDMQTKLNDYVSKKKGITDHTGAPLTMSFLTGQGASGEPLGPNSEVNEWIHKYLLAMEDETRELKQELLWKWWSKDILDMQNIRVEIIDQLHFWVSLAMVSGMGAEDVFRMYQQKNQVNFDRQDNGYSRATKDHGDNLKVNL